MRDAYSLGILRECLPKLEHLAEDLKGIAHGVYRHTECNRLSTELNQRAKNTNLSYKAKKALEKASLEIYVAGDEHSLGSLKDAVYLFQCDIREIENQS